MSTSSANRRSWDWGPVLAAVSLAEIGDVTRFPSPASWPAGPG